MYCAGDSSAGCPQPRINYGKKPYINFFNRHFSVFYARLGTARATNFFLFMRGWDSLRYYLLCYRT